MFVATSGRFITFAHKHHFIIHIYATTVLFDNNIIIVTLAIENRMKMLQQYIHLKKCWYLEMLHSFKSFYLSFLCKN